MEVHVIRHTPVNFDKNRCYGQLDVPLAASFEDDVQQVRARLADTYDLVFCSPKLRCTELAKVLAFPKVHTDDRLLELDFGDWEGQLWSAIDLKALNTWMADFVHIPPTNGESYQDMFNRVTTFITDLRSQKFEKVLIITHAGVIRCFWAYLLEIPLNNSFKIPVGFHEHFVFKLGSSTSLDSITQLK